MDRTITKDSEYSWWVSCEKSEDGGARITMDSSDGFFMVEYDAKWGEYGRYTLKDPERYPSWEVCYDMADKTLFAVENDLILVD